MSHGRVFTRVTAVWPSASHTSSALPVPLGHLAGGILHISGDWTNSHISVQISVFGQWNNMLDWQAGYTGVSIPSASANHSLQMPPAWFYLAGKDSQVRFYSHNGTGSGVVQGNVRYVVCDFKD